MYVNSVETLGVESFGSGTKKRLPICFCLDASGSMKGPRMDRLNEAMNAFVRTLESNNDAMASADIAIITYGGIVEIVRPFSPLSNAPIPEIEARERSFTPMGEGIINAIKLLEIRKQGYKAKGFKYYQPWLVLITDGKPEDPDAEANIEIAISELNELERNNKIVVFNIGVDSGVDPAILKRLSVKRANPISIESSDLASLFEFLGSSSSSVVKGGTSVSVLYDDIPNVNGNGGPGNNSPDVTGGGHQPAYPDTKPDDFDILKWLND